MDFTPYLDLQTRKYYIARMNNPKVLSFFSKVPVGKGNVKARLAGKQLTDDKQLNDFLEQMEELLKKRIWNTLIHIRKPYTKEKVNELLSLTIDADILGIEGDTYQFANTLSEWARFMVKTISEDAEKEFRKFPSSENFFKWMSTRKMVDVIGCRDEYYPESFAASFKWLFRKPYTIVAGDTLSKLALKFYGHTNLWDIIYLQNKLNYHPDQIVPGQKLFLP